MSALKESVCDKINELSRLIVEAKNRGDNESVAKYEEEKKSLSKQLTELNVHSGGILTDSPLPRRVLNG